jgi:hypothetical protein
MSHYPHAHRRYALLYPWSASVPTFTDFEFVNWHNPSSPPTAVRLGAAAFANGLSDMLTTEITSAERGVPANLLRARFDVKAASIPSGWSVSSGYAPFAITFKYWTQTATPTTPTTRPQRRTTKHSYAITAQVVAFLTMSNGTFSHTLSLGGNWGGFTSPTTGQFTATDDIPSITRMARDRYSEHSIARGSANLSSYSSSVSGFGSNVVRDHLLAMQTTIDSEIAAATVEVAYRIAAVSYGVPAAVTNSTGSNSLENWVPITF